MNRVAMENTHDISRPDSAVDEALARAMQVEELGGTNVGELRVRLDRDSAG